jgi:hypothetical protein
MVPKIKWKGGGPKLNLFIWGECFIFVYMYYILEDFKTGVKIYITHEQKELLDYLADIEYSPVDTKIYIVNKNKYYLTICR